MLELHKPTPDQDVINHLARLLAQAKDGTLTAIAYVSLEGGETHTGGPGTWRWNELLGALARLSHRVQTDMDRGFERVEVPTSETNDDGPTSED